MVAERVPQVRRVVTYERVSSQDQRERETIKTQTDQLDRWLEREPDVVVVDRFSDDGVSGRLELIKRPSGRALIAAAGAGRFDELWLYKLDRLGRNLADTAATGQRLEELGISVVTLREGRLTPFMFDLFAMLAQNEHRVFHERTADGIETAALEGRYLGGVTALGYRIEGIKRSARHVTDETPIWGDLTAAGLIRRIYGWIGLDGWSCRRVADELNSLGVPTACAREGKGVRTRNTQSIWRAGLIRNMVANPVYKGQLEYGRRSKKRDREVLVGTIEGLVTPELWQAAQDTFAANRRCTKNTRRIYLLRGAMSCGICGLNYVGSWSKDFGWYRCGGQLNERGPVPGKCLGVSVRTDRIEPAVWADIEAWLRNPGDLLDELDRAGERESASAIAARDGASLRNALESLEAQKTRLIKSVRMGILSDEDISTEIEQINIERASLEARLDAAQAPVAVEVPQEVRTLLLEVRARLDAGLTDQQRHEIVRLLASIVVHTSFDEAGKKTARAVVTYRFPAEAEAVVPTCTLTGSWRP